MNYQSAVVFPFVVRDVLAPRPSEAEAEHLLGLSAVTLTRLVGADGQGEFWCAQLNDPVCRRISDADSARYGYDMVGRDGEGLYAWAHYIALRPHYTGVFGPDCPDVAADLAYVVDVSLGVDAVFESHKVDWAATVIVGGSSSANEGRPATVEMSQVVGDPATPRRLDGAASAEDLGRGLDKVVAALADLTGTDITEIPRPAEVKARSHSRHRGVGPSYSWDGREMRYHTVDPSDGQLVWWSTADLDEGLFWMADDVARSVALSWARRAPASQTMSDGQVRWMLAIPMWLTLMASLNLEWAEKTRSRIALLRRSSQRSHEQAQDIAFAAARRSVR